LKRSPLHATDSGETSSSIQNFHCYQGSADSYPHLSAHLV
jgi:hypothetical protein